MAFVVLDRAPSYDDEYVSERHSNKLAVNTAHVVGVIGSEDEENVSIVFLAHRPKGFKVQGSVEEVMAQLGA